MSKKIGAETNPAFSPNASLRDAIKDNPLLSAISQSTRTGIIAAVLALDTKRMQQVPLHIRLAMLIHQTFQASVRVSQQSGEKGQKKTEEAIAEELGFTLEQTRQAKETVGRTPNLWNEYQQEITKQLPLAKQLAQARKEANAGKLTPQSTSANDADTDILRVRQRLAAEEATVELIGQKEAEYRDRERFQNSR